MIEKTPIHVYGLIILSLFAFFIFFCFLWKFMFKDEFENNDNYSLKRLTRVKKRIRVRNEIDDEDSSLGTNSISTSALTSSPTVSLLEVENRKRINFERDQVQLIYYNDGQSNTRNFDSPNRKRDLYISSQNEQSIIIDLASEANKPGVKFKSSKTNEQEYSFVKEEENYAIYDNNSNEIDEHDYLMEYQMFLIDCEMDNDHEHKKKGDQELEQQEQFDSLISSTSLCIPTKIESRHNVCNNNINEKFSAPELKIDTSFLSPPDENREITRRQWPQMDVENIDPKYLCPPGWHIRRMHKMFFEHRHEYRNQMRGCGIDKE
ncbi:7729_t:CDS:1 [Ambispora leptoticha]|uniref:7729_t:CDS:1 n=1 Tax=Ambispora leptoticha TaxID=144679 RepID=A0A9N8VT71_9GLOM|nr:7729_t:CDS:1 [Ambispora leptoticha]